MPSQKKKKDTKEDVEHFELSEEELEEERQDIAARYIQSAYRAKMARDTLKLMIRQNFVKLKDRQTGVYYYKNRTSGETMVRKPRILGNDDLPTPRDFRSPDNYDPGYSDMDAYAMIITVNTFSNDKIANLGLQADADHSTFEHLLGHDYICKFRGENVISLKNPSVLTVKDSFERLRKMVKKRSYLFLYICTHVVTLQTKVVPDNCFFCCKDTVWKSAEQAATTSISLGELCHLINILGVDRKVIAVNFAHLKPTPKSMFKSRYFYPPPDTLTRLADTCNCAVLGSCNVGTSIADMEAHTPTGQLTNQRRGALKIGAAAAGSSVMATSDHQTSVLPPIAPPKHAIESSTSYPTKKQQGEDIQHVAMMAEREMAADIVALYQKQWMAGDVREVVDIAQQRPKPLGLKWRKVPQNAKGDKNEDDKNGKVDGEEEKKSDGKAAQAESKTKKGPPTQKKSKKKGKVSEEEAEAAAKKAEEKQAEDLAKSLEEKETEAANDLGIQLALPSTREVCV